jgi:hypothetical protein
MILVKAGGKLEHYTKQLKLQIESKAVKCAKVSIDGGHIDANDDDDDDDDDDDEEEEEDDDENKEDNEEEEEEKEEDDYEDDEEYTGESQPNSKISTKLPTAGSCIVS